MEWKSYLPNIFCFKLFMSSIPHMRYFATCTFSIRLICSTWPVCFSSPSDSATLAGRSRKLWCQKNLDLSMSGSFPSLSLNATELIRIWFWSTTSSNSFSALIWSSSSAWEWAQHSWYCLTVTGGMHCLQLVKFEGIFFQTFILIFYRLKMVFGSFVFFFYIIVVYLPFVMASSVTDEVIFSWRSLKWTWETYTFFLRLIQPIAVFKKIAFHRSVNIAIRQKIESTSNFSDEAGFTCFNWFLLD